MRIAKTNITKLVKKRRDITNKKKNLDKNEIISNENTNISYNDIQIQNTSCQQRIETFVMIAYRVLRNHGSAVERMCNNSGA